MIRFQCTTPLRTPAHSGLRCANEIDARDNRNDVDVCDARGRKLLHGMIAAYGFRE